jgi:hypothetical protein
MKKKNPTRSKPKSAKLSKRMADNRVPLSKRSTHDAKASRIRGLMTDENVSRAPTNRKSGANGCSIIMSDQLPVKQATNARVMPHPGHGSPVNSKKGHGMSE